MAVDALPDKAPVNVVAVTEVKPAIVVAAEPREISVVPTVTLLFAKAVLGTDTNRAFGNVPEVMFAAFVVSVVADVAKPDTCDEVIVMGSDPAAPWLLACAVGVRELDKRESEVRTSAAVSAMP